MAISKQTTANDILNRVAAEVGIAPVTDPYSSPDQVFIQMKYLLNTAGEELVQAYPWEFLVAEHQIDTLDTDTGIYPLPDDFGYMINQTGWEQKENVPLAGPLSAQDWTYLKGRDLAQNTLYANFRIADGSFNVFPQPPPNGLDITFEYISVNWVKDTTTSPATYKQEVSQGSDVPVYDKTLITRYLKLKYLQAGGFEAQNAQADFNQTFSFITGQDKSAAIINAGRGTRGYPYLSMWNLPDTGMGLGI
jgi:hypothetical protein